MTKGAEARTAGNDFIHEEVGQSVHEASLISHKSKGLSTTEISRNTKSISNNQDAPDHQNESNNDVIVIHQSVVVEDSPDQIAVDQLQKVLELNLEGSLPDSPNKQSVGAIDTQEEEDDEEVKKGSKRKMLEFHAKSSPRHPIVNIRATKVQSHNLPPQADWCPTFLPTLDPDLYQKRVTVSCYVSKPKPKPEHPQLLTEFLTQHK